MFVRKKFAYVLGAALLGLMAPHKTAAKEINTFLHCVSTKETSPRNLELACSALAQELAKNYKVLRRNVTSFGVEEGLHIRLTIATKNRHSFNASLIWERINSGRITQKYTGQQLTTYSSDQETNRVSFAQMAQTLAKHSDLPE